MVTRRGYRIVGIILMVLLSHVLMGQRITGIVASSNHGGSYYVSNDGSDSDDGLTPATAWETVDKVNAATFKPGDSILFNRGDEWREQLTIPSSGDADAQITFSAYGTGAKPVINAADDITGWVDVYNSVDANIWGTVNPAATATWQVVVIDDVLYTQVANLADLTSANKYYLKTASTPDSIYVYSETDPDDLTAEVSARNYGIFVDQKSYITISFLDVRNAGHSGIRFDGPDNPPARINGYAVVDSVNAYRNRLGGVYFNNGYNYATVTNSVATFNGNGILTWIDCDNTLISHCYTAYGIRTAISPSSDGCGLQFFDSDSCIVENCLSEDDYVGIYLDANSHVRTMTARYNVVNGTTGYMGIGTRTLAAGASYWIYYNLIHDAGGVEIGAFDSQFSHGGNTYFYNNTIYTNATGVNRNCVRISDGANYTFKNNIYWYSNDADQYEPAIRITVDNGVVSDYNQWYRTWNYYLLKTDATSYSTIAAWNTASGEDANSQSGDPLFTTNGTDFTLQLGSPCINQGTVIAEIPQVDILGNAIVGLPDMGCFEKQ